jgi:hypothetical protein
MSKFKKLVGELQKQGKSEESAKKIAYSIGAKKYGKAGMARKAAAGRRKKNYRVGGKTPVEPLTEKEKAIIAAETERLKKAQRKIARAKADMKKYSGTSDIPTENPGYSKYIKTKNAVEDSLIKNASPMQKELNEVKRLANEMGKINMFMALDGQEALTKPVKTKIPFANRNRIKDGDDFIRESEKDTEGRYRKGFKKNPNYPYKLKKGGKVKAKKYRSK